MYVVCTSPIETPSYLEHVSRCRLDDCVCIPEGPQFWEFDVPIGRNVTQGDMTQIFPIMLNPIVKLDPGLSNNR